LSENKKLNKRQITIGGLDTYHLWAAALSVSVFSVCAVYASVFSAHAVSISVSGVAVVSCRSIFAVGAAPGCLLLPATVATGAADAFANAKEG
jgi:hypothetical protein